MDPSPPVVPEPDATLEPAGFIVDADGVRIHFLDWGGPPAARRSGCPGHPRDRPHRVGLDAGGPPSGGGARHAGFVAMDLRGHGLSDAPTEDGAYDLERHGDDGVAVAEGSGLLTTSDGRVILAGHGFGAIAAAHAGLALGDRCAGLVLVDGGWEALEEATGLDVDEFVRGLEEPPEVLSSMTAFLADRRRVRPAAAGTSAKEQAARSDGRRDPRRPRRPLGTTARDRGDGARDVRV